MTEKEINKLVDKFIPLGHSKACVFEEKYERERRAGLKKFLTEQLGDKKLKIELETKPYGPTEFKNAN